MISIYNFKKIPAILIASPLLGPIAILIALMPNKAKDFFLYRSPGRHKAIIQIGRVTFTTDVFHIIQAVDTFCFCALEKYPSHKIRNGATVVDIGAHHGMYSINAILKGAKTVLAIEPDPDNYAILAKNISDNKIRNIFPLNIALSSSSGNMVLFEGKSSGGHTISTNIRQVAGKSYTGREFKVCVYTLDALIKSEKLSPDLVKIDTQGAELEIMKGASKLLQQDRVLLVIDTHSHDLLFEAKKILSSSNFDMLFDDDAIYASKGLQSYS